MAERFFRLKKLRSEAVELWNDRPRFSQDPLSRLQKFLHFCILLWRSFTKNRCPVRASALAYASLLALIPVLAVAMSVTSSFLKKEGEQRIDEFIERFVASMTPPGVLTSGTNKVPVGTLVDTNAVALKTAVEESVPPGTSAVITQNGAVATNAPSEDSSAVRARKEVSRKINEFIQNTRSGTLGVTGGILLVFAAIGVLTRIEDTMNDIWGVARGRNWFIRVVLYWGVLTLVPLCLAGALGLATGPHLEGPKRLLNAMPFIGTVTFRVLPIVLLCLTFAAFYMLIPNTKVRWDAALIGGITAGLLLHLNNSLSVLYVSRVVSNSRIYGGLALVPVFMIGLYIFWLILLFGAQVAYAYQNRTTYMEQRQVESVNQRGREFVALRLMTAIGMRFLSGQPPQSTAESGKELSIPTRLIQQTMQTLCAANLVVETTGSEPGYLPARPLEAITCHDILLAMRAAQGQELAARDEPSHNEVYGEYNRIQEAERKVAGSVTLLALATRAAGGKLIAH
jgi:membrane protein